MILVSRKRHAVQLISGVLLFESRKSVDSYAGVVATTTHFLGQLGVVIGLARHAAEVEILHVAPAVVFLLRHPADIVSQHEVVGKDVAYVALLAATGFTLRNVPRQTKTLDVSARKQGLTRGHNNLNALYDILVLSKHPRKPRDAAIASSL